MMNLHHLYWFIHMTLTNKFSKVRLRVLKKIALLSQLASTTGFEDNLQHSFCLQTLSLKCQNALENYFVEASLYSDRIILPSIGVKTSLRSGSLSFRAVLVNTLSFNKRMSKT